MSEQVATDAALFEEGRAGEYRNRWEALQTRFVDDPQDSVSEANELVDDVLGDLSRGFAGVRESLEAQWRGGEDVSTEDLRVALQRYRSLFERLLAV